MYTLRFPFEIASGFTLSLDEELSCQHEHLLIKMARDDYYTALEISGFKSVDAAESFLGRLYSGLMWAMIDRMIPLKASLELASVSYADDPEVAAENLSFDSPVHGIVGGGRPSIHPSEKRIVKAVAGEVSVSQRRNPEDFMEAITCGIDFAKDFRAACDEELRTALDLFSTAFAEKSQRARLLTLVTSLESIAQENQKHEVAQTLMDKWEQQLTDEKAKYDPDSKAYIALDSLERELFFRRSQSLRSQIRDLVFDALKESKGSKQARFLAKRAVDIYDKRSKLTHEGHIDQSVLSKTTRDAIDICSEVLKAKLRDRIE